MAIRRMPRPGEQGEGEDHSGETERAARRSPQPEGRDGTSLNQSSTDNGLLQIDTGQLKLPQNLTEEEEEVKRFMPIDPAVLVILCFSLAFIAVIAYIIWSGWEPPG